MSKKKTKKPILETIAQQLMDGGACATAVQDYLVGKKTIREAWNACDEPGFLIGAWLWALICDQDQVQDVMDAFSDAMEEVIEEQYDEWRTRAARPAQVSQYSSPLRAAVRRIRDADVGFQRVSHAYERFMACIEEPRAYYFDFGIVWSQLDMVVFFSDKGESHFGNDDVVQRRLCDAIRARLNPPDAGYFQESWKIYCNAFGLLKEGYTA